MLPGAKCMSQRDESIRNLRLGLATIDHGGCGVVATYNTLIDLEDSQSFEEVLRQYNRGWGIRLFFFGLAGIRPNSVKRFFKRAGYRVITTRSYEQINELSKKADGCILYYRWKSKALIPPYYAHFVSYHRTVNGYRGYNGADRFRQPTDFLKKEQATGAVGIYLFRQDQLPSVPN